jgi:hypothetical protein
LNFALHRPGLAEGPVLFSFLKGIVQMRYEYYDETPTFRPRAYRPKRRKPFLSRQVPRLIWVPLVTVALTILFFIHPIIAIGLLVAVVLIDLMSMLTRSTSRRRWND